MKLAVLGASGRTGRLVVEDALEAGHQVRALVRTPSRFTLTHERLEVVAADVATPATVTQAVAGCDAVISALGPTPGDATICSAGTAAVLAAKPPRYVVVSGAGVDVAGDEKDLVGKVVSFIVRTVSPAVFADKVRELRLLEQGETPWVLVRPPRLVDGPAPRPARVDLRRSPGASITRAALARFLVEAAADASRSRQAPFVAG